MKRKSVSRPPSRASQKNTASLALILLIALPTVLFIQTATFQFLWDDARGTILKNPLLSPPSLSNALSVWFTVHSDLYMPFTLTIWSLTAAFSYTIFGALHPAPFHLTNVLIHLISTLLVWHLLHALLARLQHIKILNPPSQSPPTTATSLVPSLHLPPLFGALLYAIHPLQVEPVAWCSATKDLLATALGFTTLHLYLKTLHHPSTQSPSPYTATIAILRSKTYLLACLTLVLALASKVHAIVIIPIAVLMDFLLYRTRRPLHVLLPIIPWLLIAVIFIFVARQLQPHERLLYIPPIWSRPLIAADALSFYLQKLLLPINLCFDYGRTPQWLLSQPHPWLYALPSVLLLILASIPRQRLLFLLPLLLFYLGFLSVSGLVPFFSQRMGTVSDRYATIALLGPALALSLLAYRFPRITLPLSLVALALLTLRSHAQLQHWRNEYALCTHALRLNPQSWMAHNNLGMHYLDQMQPTLAERHLRLSIQYYPRYHDAHNNLGVALNYQSRYQEAADHLLTSISIRDTIPDTHNNLALSYIGLRRFDDAIASAQRALALDPHFPFAHFNLARAYLEKNQPDLLPLCEQHLLTGLRRLPNDHLARYYLALTYQRLGRLPEALAQAQIALRLAPAQTDYRRLADTLQTALATPRP